LAQAALNDAPHAPQNDAPPGLVAPHAPHFTSRKRKPTGEGDQQEDPSSSPPGPDAPYRRFWRMPRDLVVTLRAKLAEKDARFGLLERLLAAKDLAERDERIAARRRRVRALADVE
jgi:hypothetical protein